MARRVRANKSLIKQRYHVAKVAFPDDADLARSLGVHRSAVVRWKRGEAPAPQNWEQLIGLDAVVSLLEGFLELASIPKWLRGLNAHLGAKPGEPFSPSYIYPHQGAGRFDVDDKLVVYLAETAVHAVAEKLQRFRGQKIDRKDLIESGKPLALVECRLGKLKLADLCDPAVLVKHDIRPDVLASRDFAKTQRVAAALYKEGFAGLRWWSALSGDWHTIVVFEGEFEYAEPEPLAIGHKVVQEASVALGIQRSALTRE